MHMRVSVEFLVPCVQHHRGGGFESLFVSDHVAQRLSRRVKQQIVDFTPIPQGQRQLAKPRDALCKPSPVRPTEASPRSISIYSGHID